MVRPLAEGRALLGHSQTTRSGDLVVARMEFIDHDAKPAEPFMPTSTCGKVFYRLPAPGDSVGRVVGQTAVSSMGSDQSGMRVVAYATYVSSPARIGMLVCAA